MLQDYIEKAPQKISAHAHHTENFGYRSIFCYVKNTDDEIDVDYGCEREREQISRKSFQRRWEKYNIIYTNVCFVLMLKLINVDV